MFGKKGANCDGHTYFPDLRERLCKAWDYPKGIIAVQRLGWEIYRDRLGENDLADADILHRASIKGELDLFLDQLKDVILVGPKHLRKMTIYRDFVEVNTRNAWLSYSDTLEEVNRLVQPGDVVLYCCGMMAEVLIHDMYAEDITQIDCGSVFDPYVGVNSRQYHKNLKI